MTLRSRFKSDESYLEYLELKTILNARKSFFFFLTYMFPFKVTWNWHHKYVCGVLEKFIKGEGCPKLMIFMPPQHQKSTMMTEYLPAYALGLNPNEAVLLTMYNETKAAEYNRKIQRIIDNDKYSRIFPDTTLNSKNVVTSAKGSYVRNSSMFEIVGYRGFLKSVGLGSGIAGTPAKLSLMDDVIKSVEEAYSPTYRDKTYNWYTDELEARQHNDSRIAFTITRRHEDDLAGRLLERDGRIEDGGKWEVITLPALKENHNNPFDLRKNIGDALFPELHSRERMEYIRENSPRTFASLYQQRPAPLAGGLIKPEWFFRYNLAALDPRHTVHFYLDTAYTDKQVNDPTAILAFVRIQNKLYLKHCKVVRMNFPELIKFIPEYIASQGGSGKSAVIIEPKASGLSVIQMLRQSTPLNIIQDEPPKDSKITRVSGITPILEARRVGIPETGDWVPLFTNECAVFPNGVHDDRVDCLVGAVNKFLANNPGRQRMRGSVV